MKDVDSKAGDRKEARLRERLRAGDPASGAPPLAAEEVQAMRRAMLGAVPEARAAREAAPWRLPALAMTGLGLVAGIGFGLHAWLSGGAVSPKGYPGPVVAEVSPSLPTGGGARGTAPGAAPGSEGLPAENPAPVASGEGARPAPGSGARSGPGLPDRHVRSPRATPPRPGAAPPVLSAPTARLASAGGSIEESAPEAAPGAEPAASPAIRELQFSTPGGTRIVWVFASGDAPVSETPRPARL